MSGFISAIINGSTLSLPLFDNSNRNNLINDADSGDQHFGLTTPAVTVDLATYPYVGCLNTTSDEECVLTYRPPVRHDLLFTLSMTFVYSILGFAGIFGNLLVIVVVLRIREMRSAANLYLLNLAIADLMLVITGLPLELHEYWYAYPHPGGAIFGPVLCIFRHWASEACAYATVLTISAFTFERACTIHCASVFSASRSANVRRVSWVICGIWVVAASFAALVSYQWRIQYILSPDGRKLLDSAICVPLDELNSPALFIVPVVLFFFVPMAFITIAYLSIWRTIKRVSRMLNYGYFEEAVTPSWAGANAAGSITSTRQQFQHYHNHQQHHHQQQQQHQGVIGGDVAGGGGNGANSPQHRCSEQLLLAGGGGSAAHVNNSQYQPHPCHRGLSLIWENSRQQDRRTTTVIQVQTAVTLTFFLCWAPFHSQRLVVTFGSPEQWSEQQLKAYHIFNAIAGSLYYLEACINPAIYNLLSKKFRSAFQSTLLVATDSKTYCRFFQASHKALMARLRAGSHHRRNSPVAVAGGGGGDGAIRVQMFGVDSAVAANVALLQQQPQRFGVTRGGNLNHLDNNNFFDTKLFRSLPNATVGVAGGTAAASDKNRQRAVIAGAEVVAFSDKRRILSDDNSDSNNKNKNKRGLEMVDLGRTNVNNNYRPSKNGVPTAALSSAKKASDNLLPKTTSPISPNSPRLGQKIAILPERNLCQFCKHGSSNKHRSSSVLVPASHHYRVSGDSSNNNNRNNNNNNYERCSWLTTPNSNITLRRNSDIATVSTSQMIRELSHSVSANSNKDSGSSNNNNKKTPDIFASSETLRAIPSSLKATKDGCCPHRFAASDASPSSAGTGGATKNGNILRSSNNSAEIADRKFTCSEDVKMNNNIIT